MRRLISAQPSFTMLVANLSGGSNPSRGASGNPVKIRKSFAYQNFPELAGRGPEITPPSLPTPGTATRWGHVDYTVSPVPVNATGTITVANNAFGGPTTVRIGQYSFTSGEDFAIGAGVNNTATNLAAAIDSLPEYSAAAVGAAITVTGLVGALGNAVLFAATGSSPNNFTFSPINQRMTGAEPEIGPPVIA
jgi:hypothetical protein